MPFLADVVIRLALSLAALAAGVAVPSAPEGTLFEQVNALRAQQGRRALRQCQGAVTVARTRAQDMAEEGYFSHVSPEGASARTLLRRRGIGAGWGEAIAWTEGMPAGDGIDEVVHWWNGSPKHHRVMMSPYRCAGTGIARRARGTMYVFVGIRQG